MSVRERATILFNTKFGDEPEALVRAPGRVNLIGEHTDYNAGYVLPMTIDRELWVAFRRRSDRVVRVRSEAFVDDAEIDLDLLHRGEGWSEYLKAVAWVLQQRNVPLHGWEGIIASSLPMAAGLSSSAALTTAAVTIFLHIAGTTMSSTDTARAAQEAENAWVGVRAGIMDPLAITSAVPGHAALIDCRSLDTRLLPVWDTARFVVLDTGTRRSHTDTSYNDRRARCEAAARRLGVPSLRDAELADLEQVAADLPQETLRCARHVITENRRTLEAAEALKEGDVVRFGRLMQASHASLRDDFAVSSRPLDAMVESALEQPGCYGARLTGGGFAGAAVALVDAEHIEGFIAEVETAYREATGLRGNAFPVIPSGPLTVEQPDSAR